MIQLKNSEGVFAVPVDKDCNVLAWFGKFTFDNREDNWQLLGTCDKDSIDFDCEPYVEKLKYPLSVGWKNYNGDDDCDNPYQSFYSLLTASGVYFANPLPKPKVGREMDYDILDCSANSMYYHEQRHEQKKAWQEAESKVVEKVVIIKKVKS